jgi:hypothetical protein
MYQFYDRFTIDFKFNIATRRKIYGYYFISFYKGGGIFLYKDPAVINYY